MQRAAETDPIRLIADTTEEMEVRNRFAAHNARYLALVFLLGSIASIIAFLVYVGRRAVLYKTISAGVMLVLTITTLVMCAYYVTKERKGTLPSRFKRHFSDFLLAAYIAQFLALVIIGHRNPQVIIAATTLYVWLLVMFRMPLDRRAMTHVVFIVLGLFMIEVFTSRGSSWDHYVAFGAVHTAVFLLGSYNSRRVRTEIERDWSVRRSQAKEQLRMRDELQYAREVQLSMLPAAPPDVGWLDVAAISIPATEVGGDYFDYLPVGEKLAIVSGDVAGHGLASGIVLSAVRAGFTLLRGELGKPAGVLRRLHEVVAQATRHRMLTTANVVLFDRAAKTATIANAGHPPVIMRHADGTVVSLELFSPPLGVRLPIHVAERRIPFASGDLFVVHSDGVYESRNASGDHYGLDAIEAVIGQVAADATAEQIRDAIVADVERFRAGAPQEDDVTVVVAKAR